MAFQLSDISLRDLEVFVLAARTKSLREVSRQLNFLPAHTSKIIKGLERKLGAQLFMRSASGILLTPEGLAALSAAEKICSISREMTHDTGSRANRAPEKLWTTGSISFLATYVLAPAVCEIQNSVRKSLRFRLVEFTHNDLVAHGLKGAFELALHIEELEWTRIWESYPVGTLKWKLYGRQAHPLNGRCQERDAMRFPFIVPTDWGTRGYEIGEDFCPLNVHRRIKGNEAATAETALEICSHSDQLTFVPEVLARRWCEAGRMRPIEIDGWPVQEKEIFLTVKTDAVPRSLADTLLKTLRKNFALSSKSY